MKTYTQMKSIQNFNKKALLGALVAAGMTMASTGVYAVETATGTMTTTATLINSCSVAASPLSFGNIAALAGTGNVAAQTTVQIACTAGTTPVIYSASVRSLTGSDTAAGGSLVFNLSQVSTGGATLANTSTVNQAIGSGWTANGVAQPVTIYGQILGSEFAGKPIGLYSAAIAINVDYSL